MPNLDDEQFETYLKRFRPALPDALPVLETRPVPRRHFAFAISAVGAVAIAIVLLVSIRTISHRNVVDSDRPNSVQPLRATPPLTMRAADALLAKAPSYKALMNELALHPNNGMVFENKQSAFSVLDKEKSKL
ncbi:MAG TPA: hypothetical protein VKQ11_16035 [Candidatus Sulfotelmatobacter sp.]|nr:hypothetical protein [Candidatus Sulfotelmatobacter sp.]